MASDGACGGGNFGNLVLDIPVPARHAVSGRITRNGIAPTAAPCSAYNDIVTLNFVHSTDTRFNQSASVVCTSSGTTTWGFNALLYPGTYRVTASPQYSSGTNLPSWSTVVNAAFVVSAPASNLLFDIPVPLQHAVSGRITRNGIAPTATACSAYNDIVTLNFVHSTDTRFNQSASVVCTSSGTTTWGFNALLYPGTYRVTASPQYISGTNLPSWSTVVNAAFVVSAQASNLLFDIPVPPQTTVAGRLTINGATPTASPCSAYNDIATVNFRHLTDTRFNRSASVVCTSSGTTTWGFSALVYPGTYAVTVSPQYLSGTNLPSWDTVIVSALRVP